MPLLTTIFDDTTAIKQVSALLPHTHRQFPLPIPYIGPRQAASDVRQRIKQGGVDD